MKSSTIAILSILGILVVGGVWYVNTGNTLVSLDEQVNTAWSQVESAYQRRADLIPNLVSTVKGYAKHEAEVLESVTQSRASVGQVRVNSPEDLRKFENSQAQIGSALSRLLVVAEKYPDLKADRQFLELQSQLEGTENRIMIERRRFNEVAQQFNTRIRQFPGSFVATSKGFRPRAYFEAAKGSENAPKVEF